MILEVFSNLTDSMRKKSRNSQVLLIWGEGLRFLGLTGDGDLVWDVHLLCDGLGDITHNWDVRRLISKLPSNALAQSCISAVQECVHPAPGCGVLGLDACSELCLCIFCSKLAEQNAYQLWEAETETWASQRLAGALRSFCTEAWFNREARSESFGLFPKCWNGKGDKKKSEPVRLMAPVLCGKYKPGMTYFAVGKQRWFKCQSRTVLYPAKAALVWEGRACFRKHCLVAEKESLAFF